MAYGLITDTITSTTQVDTSGKAYINGELTQVPIEVKCYECNKLTRTLIKSRPPQLHEDAFTYKKKWGFEFKCKRCKKHNTKIMSAEMFKLLYSEFI